MTALDDVPAPERDLRCAPWTKAQGVDPIGSAPRFDALITVEWPLPWPSDVSEIAPLAAACADLRALVLAVVPHEDHAADGFHRIVHHRRVGTHRFASVDHRVRVDEVAPLLERLLDDVDGSHLDWPSAVGTSGRADVLLCGHGKRDACCGRMGTLVHAELAARRPDLRVWRCSHTGGHRFAPTGITATDGRAWAFADADVLVGAIDRTLPVRELHGHDRGTSALGLWGQALERAVFEHLGWDWLDAELTGTDADVAEDRRSASVTLAWRAPDGSEHAARGEVHVVRDVPVLVCGEPPEAAKKSSYEVAVVAVEVDGTALTR